MKNETLEKLKRTKTNYQTMIRENFEFKAKDCITCETKGVCCTDAHFVNVHITELEAGVIIETLSQFPVEKQTEIFKRVENTVEKYHLKDSGNTFAQTYACPLFEAELGCIIHGETKPLPCMSHACYEKKEDLPPQFLEDYATEKVEKLNREAFGEASWLPLPVWLNVFITQNSQPKT